MQNWHRHRIYFIEFGDNILHVSRHLTIQES